MNCAWSLPSNSKHKSKMEDSRKQITVIGGGLVGLGTALKLLRRSNGAPISVTVLEKEAKLCLHQSTHNSGVLHAGLYYKPGSLKARLAVTGIREMLALCQEKKVPHETCGKLVVATDEAEQGRLKALFERGMANGLTGLRLLSREQMLEIEPHVAGVAALHVPQEGIVDYLGVSLALKEEIESRGGRIVLNAKVTGLNENSGKWRIQTSAGEHQANFIVNCAGLYCDRVSELAGEHREVRIIPFRGEYYKIRPDRQYLVRNLIYPVPDPEFPFLGVHFTRLIHGGIEAGPNAVLAFSREGYRKTDFKAGDLWDALTFPGLWRFLARHWQMGLAEMRRSFSRRLFCDSLRKLVPEVRETDLETGGAGVRAQAMSPAGELVQDFCLVSRPGALHVLNAPSPAATASLSIGEEIARTVSERV
jgi:(S)-2-hydroxyglutarate dehydrogenase